MGTGSRLFKNLPFIGEKGTEVSIGKCTILNISVPMHVLSNVLMASSEIDLKVKRF